MTGFVLAQGTHQTGCTIAEIPGITRKLLGIHIEWITRHLKDLQDPAWQHGAQYRLGLPTYALKQPCCATLLSAAELQCDGPADC